jgi:carbamoyl-phosphate synthase small subunit
VVKELSRVVSNWRSEMSVDAYLQEHGVPGIEGIDTRELTKRLRTVGALMGIVSGTDLDVESLLAKVRSAPGLSGRDLVQCVTCDRPFPWQGDGGSKLEAAPSAQATPYHVVVLDCGVKYGILRRLHSAGCRVTVMPSSTTAEQVAELNPDGLMLSNGPGDPEPVTNVIATVQKLIAKPPCGRALPIFGICLGQQILGLALGGKTYKLKFGHHGANQPVKDLATGQVAITVQNHGFCVDIDSLPKGDIEITHMNLNDNTLEGFRHKRLPIFSVQYHPEASPGPHDAQYLFHRFVELMKETGK